MRTALHIFIYLLVWFVCLRFGTLLAPVGACVPAGFCGVSAFAVGGRAVSGRADRRTLAGARVAC
jgi:hypothetical protein